MVMAAHYPRSRPAPDAHPGYLAPREVDRRESGGPTLAVCGLRAAYCAGVMEPFAR